MIKSAEHIEQDMYLILEEFMADKIGGNFYPSECRPMDSMEEDAVIAVSAATGEQIQEGTAMLNIYVSDQDNGSGRMVPDRQRILELSSLTEEILNLLNTNKDYSFTAPFAPKRRPVPEIAQHYINYQIKFKLKTF